MATEPTHKKIKPKEDDGDDANSTKKNVYPYTKRRKGFQSQCI